jgi:hypothetical protein
MTSLTFDTTEVFILSANSAVSPPIARASADELTSLTACRAAVFLLAGAAGAGAARLTALGALARLAGGVVTASAAGLATAGLVAFLADLLAVSFILPSRSFPLRRFGVLAIQSSNKVDVRNVRHITKPG